MASFGQFRGVRSTKTIGAFSLRRWLPGAALLTGLGVVISLHLVFSMNESAAELINQQLWSEASGTTELPTWRVSGTLNPVVGGVEQVIDVPKASSPTLQPAPVSTASPAPASPVSPGSPASPTSASSIAPVQNSIAWVPPPKPWEPLGNLSFLDSARPELSPHFLLIYSRAKR